MAVARPCMGFPSRTDAVVYLASKGMTDREIARAISVQHPLDPIAHTTVSKLRHSRIKALPRTPLEIRLPKATAARLTALATARGQHTHRLAAQIIEIVVSDDLLNAILDDGDGA